MTEDEALTREMAYTGAGCHDNNRCGNPHDPVTSCCRPRNHNGDHAAGHGTNRKRWP